MMLEMFIYTVQVASDVTRYSVTAAGILFAILAIVLFSRDL